MRTAGFGTSWFRGWPSTSFILAGRPPRTFPRGAAIPLSITSRTCFSPSSRRWRRWSGRWPTVRENKLADLKERLKSVKRRLGEVEKFDNAHPNSEVKEALGMIAQSRMLDGLDADLVRAEAGERESEVRAYKRLLELEGTAREMHRRQQRSRIQVSIGTLRAAVT